VHIHPISLTKSKQPIQNQTRTSPLHPPDPIQQILETYIPTPIPQLLLRIQFLRDDHQPNQTPNFLHLFVQILHSTEPG
jgi:hypothetical protein